MLENFGETCICTRSFGTFIEFNRNAETKHHAGNSCVNTGFKEKRPRDKAQGQKQNPRCGGLEVQHFFATIGDKGEQRDRDDRKEQVFAMECAGVEDCNNADSDQVINHCQGKKEDAHRRGQERAHARQYGNREGNVGCRGNSPAMYSGGAAEVDSGVDDGGGYHAAESRCDGNDRGCR